ncbi:MAG: acyl carrier protein [Cyanobacteria bacterium J06628_3]
MTTKQSMNATEIQTWLLSNLAEILHMAAEEIDVTQPLDSYGLDSTQAMVIVTKATSETTQIPAFFVLW